MKVVLALSIWLAAATAGIADDACRLDPIAAPDAALIFPGVVRGPAFPEEVASQTAIAVAKVHAPMNPRYADLPRVFVFFVEGGVRHGTIAAVLGGTPPAAGENVVLASRHRDPDSPCAFVPWTVTPGSPQKPTS